jgi:hypothetical protein
LKAVEQVATVECYAQNQSITLPPVLGLKSFSIHQERSIHLCDLVSVDCGFDVLPGIGSREGIDKKVIVKYSSEWLHGPFIMVSVSFISWKCFINISNCIQNI